MELLISTLCILLSCGLVHHLLSRSRSRKENLPPGPTPLPIIGDILKLGKRPHHSLAELAKLHGPVMSLRLGSLAAVVISSSSAAKEVLQKKDNLFCDRSMADCLTACQYHEFSLAVLPDAPKWRSLRRICKSHVSATSMLDSSHSLRRDKLEDLLCYIRNQNGAPINIGKDVFNTSLNLMSNPFLSVDLVDYKNDEFNFKELAYQIIVEVGKPNLSYFYPILKRLDPQGVRRRLETHFGKMINLFNGAVAQRIAE